MGIHPLVAKKRAKGRPVPRGIGIVYGKDGAPRIDADWIANLTPDQRAWAENDLAAHGYKLVGNSVEKL